MHTLACDVAFAAADEPDIRAGRPHACACAQTDIISLIMSMPLACCIELGTDHTLDKMGSHTSFTCSHTFNSLRVRCGIGCMHTDAMRIQMHSLGVA